MAKLDYLVTKLNLHGVNPVQSPGAGGKPELVQNDVYAALGLGRLSPAACIIGLAVHTQDDRTIRQARTVGTFEVDRLFVANNWSATKPFQNRVNQWVREGTLAAADAKAEKLLRGETLKSQMAWLAIDELLDNNICKKCGGTGYIKAKPHDACKGTGKRKHSESYNAERCLIEYDAWLKTWRHRYRVVRNHLTEQLDRFENHLERHA